MMRRYPNVSGPPLIDQAYINYQIARGRTGRIVAWDRDPPLRWEWRPYPRSYKLGYRCGFIAGRLYEFIRRHA